MEVHFDCPQKLCDTTKLRRRDLAREFSQSWLDIDIHNTLRKALTNVEDVLHKDRNGAHVGLEVVLCAREISACRNQIAKLLVARAHGRLQKVERSIAPFPQRLKVHGLQDANTPASPAEREFVSAKPADLL